jgi:SAM-dependent methyltransferase
VTNFFETDASRYEEAVKHSIAFAGAEHELFLAAKARLLLDMAACLGPVSELKVLDVGCGNGKLDLSLQPHVGELHGTDVADQMIAEARLLNPSGHYQPYDGRVLPYVDKTFDLVFAVCVFHHVEREARPALISEMARVVRIGGMAAIAEHNPLNPLTRMAVSRCEFDEDAQLLRAREADRLLIEGGLDRARHRYLLFLPTLAPWWVAVERRLVWLPLGAQYIAAATRSR